MGLAPPPSSPVRTIAISCSEAMHSEMLGLGTAVEKETGSKGGYAARKREETSCQNRRIMFFADCEEVTKEFMRGEEREGRAVMAKLFGAAAIALAFLLGAPVLAQNKTPIRIGFSIAQTGALSGAGRSGLVALQIWRDDVNARGGLLGRPVELVVYDDQTNPALTPVGPTGRVYADTRIV